MKVCLLTTGQLSTDPRLLKEADALAEAGYQVTVLAAHWTTWAAETDAILLSRRSWECGYVGGGPEDRRLLYGWTRLRHRMAGRLLPRLFKSQAVRHGALARVSPELRRTVQAVKSDLYIAHNLGALPAAVEAAWCNGSVVGFDAEDFHSGVRRYGSTPSTFDRLIEEVESAYLPYCDYITAGSDGIADAYSSKYDIPRPVPVLNAFPLAMRPSAPRLVREGPLTLYWFSQTIGENRGLEDVLSAMALLPECDLELHLRGIWQLGFETRLRGRASSLGLRPDQVRHHLPGPPDDMVRLAASFDVGLAVEPCNSENNCIALSNKVLTYVLAGTPVLATATAGQEPVVRRIGAAGALYRPGEARALADHIKHWYYRRGALQLARDEAWEWGTRLYNWDLEKERFLAVVETTLAGRGAASYSSSRLLAPSQRPSPTRMTAPIPGGQQYLCSWSASRKVADFSPERHPACVRHYSTPESDR
jgi:glycosyltransferase involved in cell wall biosynthesis